MTDLLEESSGILRHGCAVRRAKGIWVSQLLRKILIRGIPDWIGVASPGKSPM